MTHKYVLRYVAVYLTVFNSAQCTIHRRNYHQDHVTYRTTSPVLYQLYNVTATYCAVRCTAYLYPCYCYTYIKQTRECNLASWPVPSPTLMPSAQVLYSTGTFCNTTANFTIMNNGSVTSCMWMSTDTVTYNQAQSACEEMGAHLFTIKNLDKLNIIQAAVTSDFYWVGLNDVEQEGGFVWVDDGSEITTLWRNLIFHQGHPKGGRIKNCVGYDYTLPPLIATQCDDLHKYICEVRPLPVD